MTASVLERILAEKRKRLADGEFASKGTAARPTDGKRFVEALRGPGFRIIAEIKRQSPSAGEILHDANGRLETIALAYRRGHAAALSVVTEQDFFGGRPEWVSRAKATSGLPTMMKDFILSERQLDFAVSLGADAVLLIALALGDDELASLAGGARRRGLAVVVEAHDEDEIRRAAAVAPDVLGINARDLATFETNLPVTAKLAAAIPPGPVRLAESGIRSREDVANLLQAGYEAFLVGEALLRSEDPEEMLRELSR
jgi:indole-3-glycerol phosphate synthase